MDLKQITTNVTADSFEFNGTAFELVKYLRELALNDLGHFIDIQQVTATNYEESPDYVDEGFEETNENDEGFEGTDDVEFYPESLPDVETPPVLLKDTIDLEISSKLDKFSRVIGYLTNIIKTDGVITESSTIVQDILNKFKELDGIVAFYSTFEIATGFTSVGEQ